MKTFHNTMDRGSAKILPCKKIPYGTGSNVEKVKKDVLSEVDPVHAQTN